MTKEKRVPRDEGVNDSWESIVHAFEQAGSIALCAHVNPDGDAIGSILLLMHALDKMGKQVTPLLAQDRPLPGLYDAFKGAERFLPAAGYEDTPDLFVSLDVPSLPRLGDAQDVALRAGKRVSIDHHPDLGDWADLSYGDANAAACACVLWDFIKTLDVDMDRDMAEACYLAVLTDTGSFRFQNTDAWAFRVVAECVEAGARPSWVSDLVYQNKSLAVLRMQGLVAERLTFQQCGSFPVVYSWAMGEDFDREGCTEEECDELIDVVRAVGGADVAVLFRERDGVIRASLRAKNDLNVGDVARSLGGGGHDAAAGCTLEEPLEVAIRLVLEGIGSAS